MTAVSYSVAGPDGAPVVVLANSLGATRGMWHLQVPALAERFRVLTFDARGHGESPAPPGPYTLDDLADDVLALLDEIGAERAHLVGLSLGGMTALRLAARDPERVLSLAVLSSSARPDPQPYVDRAAAVRAGGTAPLAPAVVGRWLTPAYAAEHPDQVARLEAMVAGCDDEGYACCAEVVAAVDLRADLGRITAPTLVMGGAEDQALPPEHQRAIAAGIPGADLWVLTPAAHLVNIEQPEQVTGLLLGHLDAARAAR